MKLTTLAAAAACAGATAALGGCAEVMTTMMMVSDQMALEQGYYYDDAHYSEGFGSGACSGLMETGIVNNQSYLRIRNYSNASMEVTAIWNSGLESPFFLAPGEASQFVYLSPSVQATSLQFRCQ